MVSRWKQEGWGGHATLLKWLGQGEEKVGEGNEEKPAWMDYLLGTLFLSQNIYLKDPY